MERKPGRAPAQAEAASERQPGRARAARAAMALAALLAAGTAFGCGDPKDVGLVNRNTPLDQAEHRTFKYPVYQAFPDSVPIIEVGGNRWQATAPIETIEPRLLTSIGNVQGTVVYALNWDQAPYDRLYTPVGENRWRILERVR